MLNSCSASFISCSEIDYCEPVQRLALVCEEKRLFLSWCLRASNQGGKVAYNGGVFALLSASQQLLRQRKVTKVAALRHATLFKDVIMQVTFLKSAST